eukprot:Amastigsp_a841700_941.p3 type:complete len:119 gc:universal Amastigsp_a841700_941:520-876(+)
MRREVLPRLILNKLEAVGEPDRLPHLLEPLAHGDHPRGHKGPDTMPKLRGNDRVLENRSPPDLGLLGRGICGPLAPHDRMRAVANIEACRDNRLALGGREHVTHKRNPGQQRRKRLDA